MKIIASGNQAGIRPDNKQKGGGGFLMSAGWRARRLPNKDDD
jgi:hypothetical protein